MCRLFTVVVLVALLAGCGSKAPATTTTTTTPGASPQRAASAVAEHRASFTDPWGEYENCQNRRTSLLDCLSVSNRIDRQRNMTQGAINITTSLEAVGPVDTEVEGLVDRTLNAGRAIRIQWVSELAPCIEANKGKSVDPCEAAFQKNIDLSQQFNSVLTAWEPYL